ncbi:AMP-binding protein [Streptomyces sp. NPDC058861]|uniref:AMP-binding protein n=1 Tax=Streptomyces sp. NPDC058861 TaxID=3346653 RepID=UPI0036C09D47
MPTFDHPHLPLDGLLRRAAERNPDGPALRDARGTHTFAELDARADRIAQFLERSVGRRGARIGVANTLDASFAATYYGTARSGNTVVLINPLVKEVGLLHVMFAAGVELAFVPTPTAELLAKTGDRLPRLGLVVVTDAEDGIVPGDAVPLGLVLDAVATAVPGPGQDGERRPVDPDSDVCVQFTTGTTGRPKGVRLTHRNLVANAVQTAAAHHLDAGSVALNHLPLHHVMHLNSAVYAGAFQVLCADPDPIASLALAERAGATHYYGLPARLHALAADPRLSAPGLPGVPAHPRLTAVLSGGTALDPNAARVLRERLGVPVVQGYGMAELSPLTHSQDPRDPRPGSVGTPVPGTECRIVDPETRAPLPAGAVGEVQVRGPQLMAGYLGESRHPAGADGWFPTADVGRLDEDGVLFLVDRLGDVFKYDNELVSPTLVEGVLGADPRVAECVVVGRPDPVHGATTWAGVVLRDTGDDDPGEVLADVTERANGLLSAFERIRHAELLDAVPRTPVGKPARAALRRSVRTRASAVAPSSPSSSSPSDPSSPGAATMVTFVNKLSVHGDLTEFLAAKSRVTAYMSTQPGYISHQTLRMVGAPNVYVELAVWEDAAAHRAAVTSEGFQRLVKGLAALATPEPGLYETVADGTDEAGRAGEPVAASAA